MPCIVPYRIESLAECRVSYRIESLAECRVSHRIESLAECRVSYRIVRLVYRYSPRGDAVKMHVNALVWLTPPDNVADVRQLDSDPVTLVSLPALTRT